MARRYIFILSILLMLLGIRFLSQKLSSQNIDITVKNEYKENLFRNPSSIYKSGGLPESSKDWIEPVSGGH